MENLDISEIFKAREVLKNVAVETPVVGPTNISDRCEVYLKAECLQLTGSFKLRGAYYKISQLSDEEKSRGVIACSAGNHAQGVALGATHNGIKSLICLPAGAPLSKIEATKRLGAEVCLVDGVYDDAYEKALELRDKEGYTFVHPFDDVKVIAGQGTIGIEIIEQLPQTQAIVVPIGGGGLISGIAFAVKTLRPDIKIYGVQAEGAPSMKKSIDEGKRVHLDSVSTIADGISVKEPGINTFEMCRKYVDEVVTVTDDEVAAAILNLLEKQKMVAEGAGAVSVAAVMFNKLPVDGKKVVCVVSGGNIDVNILNRAMTRGLVKSGRVTTVTLDLSDRPGALSGVCKVIADLGANVLSVIHERVSTSTQINGCVIHMELETRNNEHVAEIRKGLEDAGYSLITEIRNKG
ncbi:MAG: threonine ammonia-lyase [Muribaculaceae bacterium]|nr:threonine ammonia-lyase [Muribaculaceae bacterium]